jgi:integrase
LLLDWISVYLWEIKRARLKAGTFGQYVEHMDRYIAPSKLAKMKMVDIRRFHIQSFIDGLEAAGLSPFTIRQVYAVVRGAFNEAARRGVIPVSYAGGVSLPVRKAKPPRVLTKSEQSVFLEAIAGHRLEAAFVLALTTGLREGEIAALKWSDLQDGAITVTRNARRVSEFDPVTRERAGSRVIIQETPKTAAGARFVPILPIAAGALHTHRQKQNDERVKNRIAYVDGGLMFCDEIGRLYDPAAFRKALQKILAAAGLPVIRFHELRKTFATRGLEAGMTLKGLQSILGHETPEMVMHYQELLQEQSRVEMDKLKGVFLP